MTIDTIVPVERNSNAFNLSDPEFRKLVRDAKTSDVADRSLGFIEALRKYKRAVLWAMLLATSLVMEGYDFIVITSFYGQTQFKQRFGIIDPATGHKLIPPAWQSGLSNSSLVGQLIGLALNGYAQDRFGCRRTMMFFQGWMFLAIFAVVFAPSLPVIAFGELLCGVSWGGLQTLSIAYASEVVPIVLRPYLTAYVSMSWGIGILISSGIVRAMVGLDGNVGWQLPFGLQWTWPLPLLLGAYLAPESPWNAVRRGNITEARKSLARLRQDCSEKEQQVHSTLAYIIFTTKLEAHSSFLECFRGINMRRTEINCMIWASQIFCGNAILGYSIVFLQLAGFSEVSAFNVNISLSACYVIGGIICWVLFPHFGRVTIYMTGLTLMFLILMTIGGLGWAHGRHISLAIGVLLVICTLVNKITIGPTSYAIISETPSGRLRYKTIVVGRSAYNLIAIFHNSVTPRMLSPIGWNWGAKTALFYAGTNLLCNIWCWFRLPETKDRSFGEIDLLFENKIPARSFKGAKVSQFELQNREPLTGNRDLAMETRSHL